MKGYHRIQDDLGCLTHLDRADAWIEPVFEDGLLVLEQHLRLRAEFEQYLAERGDIE